MYSHANHREDASRAEAGPAEILEAVGALREYMRSMDDQVKELLAERNRLAAEVDRLSGQPGEPTWKAGAERVTDELDQLVRLYESTSRRRTRARSSAPAPGAACGSDSGAWMKKMFMLLMLSDMV
jgi:hypothetical protein